MKDRILKYVNYYIEANGYAPSQAEIGRGLNASRQRVNKYFHEMQNELSHVNEYKRFFNKENKG